jgi:hypothetical protein
LTDEKAGGRNASRLQPTVPMAFPPAKSHGLAFLQATTGIGASSQRITPFGNRILKRWG